MERINKNWVSIALVLAIVLAIIVGALLLRNTPGTWRYGEEEQFTTSAATNDYGFVWGRADTNVNTALRWTCTTEDLTLGPQFITQTWGSGGTTLQWTTADEREERCCSVNLKLWAPNQPTKEITHTGCYHFHGEFAFDDFVKGPCLTTLGYDSIAAPWEECGVTDYKYRIYYPKKVGFGELYAGEKTFFWVFRNMETSRLFFNSSECIEALIWNIKIPEGYEIFNFTYVSSEKIYHWE